MSFEPKTWACGDTITAEELNRMEQGIVEASDKGYECSEGMEVLADESVTMGSSPYNYFIGTLSYNKFIDEDEITVEFGGVEYTLQKNESYSSSTKSVYGAVVSGSDLSTDYPFGIESDNYGGGNVTNEIKTSQAGTHSIKIEVPSIFADVTPCFKTAVMSVMDENEEEPFVQFFDIVQTGQNEWTPSISASDMWASLVGAGVTFIGSYGNASYGNLEYYYFSNVYDAGYGMTGLEFVCIRTDDSSVKLKTFKFTTGGNSSYEEKTLTVQ